MSRNDETFFCSLLLGESVIWYGNNDAKVRQEDAKAIFGNRKSCEEFDLYLCKFKKENCNFFSRHFKKKRLFFQTNEVIWSWHIENGFCPQSLSGKASQFIPFKIPLNLSLARVVDNDNFESSDATTSLVVLDGKTMSFHVEHCGGSMFVETCEDTDQTEKVDCFKKNILSFYRDIKNGNIEHSNIIRNWSKIPKKDRLRLEKEKYKSTLPNTLRGITTRPLWVFSNRLTANEKTFFSDLFFELGHKNIKFEDLKSNSKKGLKKIAEKAISFI